ncbi:MULTISPECIES: hypothetical protein [unclassified Rhizobium]|uniref:hypothetical protein n=1 Tax=unclassified Rhizobium TaxID=2613769 RepID=UPI0012DC82A0|nr:MULTISPECIES: hypothetical protein [unclassified Rhizobium]QYA13663.1 hypothetical protein J5284_05430 [Rhizobium sp. AB2/73]UEQ80407.1 hypothetical protein I8E17_16570 [Rhizobium sp. AB2/73]
MNRRRLAEKLLEVEVANKRAMALTQRLAELEIEIRNANQMLANLQIPAKRRDSKSA